MNKRRFRSGDVATALLFAPVRRVSVAVVTPPPPPPSGGSGQVYGSSTYGSNIVYG